MIEAFVKSTNEGRELFVRGDFSSFEMENRMIAEIRSSHIIKPEETLCESMPCLKYTVTKYISLKEYLRGRRLSEEGIIGIMAGLFAAADALKGHLLGEENLILDEEYIFVDRFDSAARFCAIPLPADDIGPALRKLTETLLLSADQGDREALRLSALLFREAMRSDLRLYDLKNAILPAGEKKKEMKVPLKEIEPAAAGLVSPHEHEESLSGIFSPRFEENEEPEKNSHGKGGSKSIFTVGDLDRMDMGSIGLERDMKAFRGENASFEKAPAPKKLVFKIALSQFFMFLGLLIVFLVKGKATVIKAVPIYIILSLCMGAYFALGALFVRGTETEESAADA